MRILIIGDIGASISNGQDFCTAESSLISPQIQAICREADIVLLNLEKPLTDILTPLGKCAPDYAAPKQSIQGILLLNPTAVTLANNHIMDQCEQGLFSTISTLEEHEVSYVGAGININKARKPLILNRKGMRVGVYACCEKEYSFATSNAPGANIFDPLESLDDIAKLRKQCDYLIVLYHGGMQDYPYPTPYQQRVCRKMCEKGANFVACQHSHIIGCEEEYHGSQILYGQGNFLLDEKNDQNWHEGLIAQITVETGRTEIKYVPVQTVEHKVKLHENSSTVLERFVERSCRIKDDCWAQAEYKALCEKKLPTYLVKLSGATVFMQRVIRRLKLEKQYSRLFYRRQERNLILDYLYCASHREAIETGLESADGNERQRHKQP